ncbi:uncharacterized protein APUU_40022A [Aspergillus puulaauensis]|uniref:Beta-xylosidase C-terminal Concanavalin A-like domain-containing protein n=1 Tax=Aspergillus puulaauensis TaxID=1220207 RepID=A0A7R7XMB2_9EURO|nr:uncharacterized protein APUU_40022A [Aspergillus puulaauensis]BCS23578.1 hypothetical protein APUU_40022A [Aspergillus puulaauensis]
MLGLAIAGLGYGLLTLAQNSTVTNPILPGFYPDPSCIFVPELDDTFFCASSSFRAFPGVPITASRDLQSWALISHAFNRPEQLPVFAGLHGSAGGIWAPTLRYRNGTFYIVSTCVNDDIPSNDTSRWTNFIVSTTNLTAPNAYISWAMLWNVRSGIKQATIDIKTGEIGQPVNIWNGTGGLAPEGPHTYKKDGFYYLLIAEGGTGLDHSATIARSRSINGQYDSNPANPILTNANTTEYFQAVAHADLFQDGTGNWWGVALSMRLDLQARTAPMGRETVLYPVTWKQGQWPVISQVKGRISSWPLPQNSSNKAIPGLSVTDSEDIDFLEEPEIPPNFLYYGVPDNISYEFSKGGLCLTPSSTGNTSTDNVTRILRRQSHSLFTYSVDVDWSPTRLGDESGVTIFIDTDNHLDLGIVQLPGSNETATTYLRFQGKGALTAPQPTIADVASEWKSGSITLEIKAFNATHLAFSAGPAAHESQLKTIAVAPSGLIQPIFTGASLGVYTTVNDSASHAEACFTPWRYNGDGQFHT